MTAGNNRTSAPVVCRVLAGLLPLFAALGCGTTPQGNANFAQGGGSYDFPDLGTLAKIDAGASKDLGTSTKDQTGSDTDDTVNTDDSGNPAEPDGQAKGSPDSSDAGVQASEDTGETPGDDPGITEDAGAPEEDAEPEDIVLVKDAKADNGEDPSNPWYNNPIPDEYALPDLPDAGGGSTDSNGQATPPLCAPKTASLSVTETFGPGGKLDIIIWVDTSGSMTEEAKWVSTNISKFAGFVANKKIDYRLVLVGVTQSGVTLCAGPPLGTGSPACSSADAAKFMVVKKPIQSTDGLLKLIQYYPDFKAFLRPEAVKNIIAVTDDNSSMTAANFTAQWNALQPAGAAKFVYHGIVSYNNDTNPVASTSKCSTGATLSKVHIELATQTGGYLFQLCKQDWTPAFDALAQAVAATAKPVCTYKIPVGPSVAYTPSAVKILHIENGNAVALPNLCGPEACAGAPSGWFYDDPKKPTTVTLCPEKCKALVGGALAFNFGCAMSNPPPVGDAGSTDTTSGDTVSGDTISGDAGDVKMGNCDVP